MLPGVRGHLALAAHLRCCEVACLDSLPALAGLQVREYEANVDAVVGPIEDIYALLLR